MVRIISITQPIIEGLDSAEELIAYCARVSNPKNQHNNATASKLLKYCADNNHWSIFEMVDVTFEITTTRDIGRQIIRHKSFSFQEFSQRYSEVVDFADRQCRMQDLKNRQNSIETNDIELIDWFYSKQKEIKTLATQVYNEALDHGVAKEQARTVLPEGLTKTTMYMKGPLRSWIHYIKLRADDATQKEHRELAVDMRDILIKYFPSIKGMLY